MNNLQYGDVIAPLNFEIPVLIFIKEIDKNSQYFCAYNSLYKNFTYTYANLSAHINFKSEAIIKVKSYKELEKILLANLLIYFEKKSVFSKRYIEIQLKNYQKDLREGFNLKKLLTHSLEEVRFMAKAFLRIDEEIEG